MLPMLLFILKLSRAHIGNLWVEFFWQIAVLLTVERLNSIFEFRFDSIFAATNPGVSATAAPFHGWVPNFTTAGWRTSAGDAVTATCLYHRRRAHSDRRCCHCDVPSGAI